MTEDLHEKLEESSTKLAALNALSFQKWVNVVSKINVKMAKAVKCSAKCIAMELKKEEKKKQNLTGPSHTANAGVSTNADADKHTAPYVPNRYNRSCGMLPPLTKEEHVLLYEHRGCFKCQCLYAGHIQCKCPNDFPEIHTPITSTMAAAAKVEFERSCHHIQGGVFNRGPMTNTSTPAVAAVIEESSKVSGDEGDSKGEEKSGIVAIMWPSAVVLGDSDSDEYSVSPLLMFPNLYWDAITLKHDREFLMVKAMIDNGADEA